MLNIKLPLRPACSCIAILKTFVCLQGLQVWQQQHAALAESFKGPSAQAADQEADNLSAVSSWISKPAQDVTSLIGFHLLALHNQQVKPWKTCLKVYSIPSEAGTAVMHKSSVRHSTGPIRTQMLLLPCSFARCLLHHQYPFISAASGQDSLHQGHLPTCNRLKLSILFKNTSVRKEIWCIWLTCAAPQRFWCCNMQGGRKLGHRASIMHEALFRWHQASWMTQPKLPSPDSNASEARGSSPAPWLEPNCQQAMALTACRTKALLWMAQHTPTPLCNRRLRSMQLQCAARQLHRCSHICTSRCLSSSSSPDIIC